MQPDCHDCATPSPPGSASASTSHPTAAQDAGPSAAPPPSVTTSEHQQDVLDSSTFVPPQLSQGEDGDELPRVVIEFCDRCRWLHRAVWTQTELFLTFPPPADVSSPPGLRAITLVPRNTPETGGRFRVWLLRYRSLEHEFEETVGKGKERWNGWELVWDRKIEGGFPELKELKQRIRNIIAPAQDLGHSDKPSKHKVSAASASTTAPGPHGSGSGPGDAGGAMSSRADGSETALEGEEGRKPGQLLASDFAPTFRCG
ncbi:hypothetical protein JCM3770_006848 [Rhodotorula araucariae]